MDESAKAASLASISACSEPTVIHSASTEDAWAEKEPASSRLADRAAAQNLSIKTTPLRTPGVWEAMS
jgi:hypothetical protein